MSAGFAWALFTLESIAGCLKLLDKSVHDFAHWNIDFTWNFDLVKARPIHDQPATTTSTQTPCLPLRISLI
jgi:hypothetical protein